MKGNNKGLIMKYLTSKKCEYRRIVNDGMLTVNRVMSSS